MVRLRHAVLALALGCGGVGCAFSQPDLAHFSIWHCDECDNFPTPAYGPGYSMMPGTYTGAQPKDKPEVNQSPLGGADLGSVPAQSGQPPTQLAPPTTTTPPATTTPPLPPAASPGLGRRTPALAPGATRASSAVAARTELDLPLRSGTTQDDQPIPVANP
jgi:hypothetical protein